MLKVTILISGSGTNMEAVLDHQKDLGKKAKFSVEKIIADRPAGGLEKAASRGFRTVLLNKRDLGAEVYNSRLLDEIKGSDIIILAGYLSVLSDEIVDGYRGRIINIHPSLLPKYGGRGMYGLNVHRAVLASGEKESGCTVHLVDEGIDTGRILVQKKVDVIEGDEPETLQKRILEHEHRAITEGLDILVESILNIES